MAIKKLGQTENAVLSSKQRADEMLNRKSEGKLHSSRLSPEQRTAIAQYAAATRWKKKR